MQVKLTVSASQNFVAKSGKLFVVIVPVESDYQFMLIRFLFCPCLKLALIEYEIVCVQSQVRLISENDLTFFHNNTL
jgi:hypothetical protein